MKQTTAKHFEIFKNEVLRWLGVFGLEHDVGFEHVEMVDCKAAMCGVYKFRTCMFSLNTNWDPDTPLTVAEIKKTAKHEAIHLLLYDLQILACARWVTRDEVDVAVESLTYKLCKHIS